MAQYRIAWNSNTNQVFLVPEDKGIPIGSSVIGAFNHGSNLDDLGHNPLEEGTQNHVIYHHIRDALFFANVFDMGLIKIGASTVPPGDPEPQPDPDEFRITGSMPTDLIYGQAFTQDFQIVGGVDPINVVLPIPDDGGSWSRSGRTLTYSGVYQ